MRKNQINCWAWQALSECQALIYNDNSPSQSLRLFLFFPLRIWIRGLYKSISLFFSSLLKLKNISQKGIFTYIFIKPAAPNALSIVTIKWMFLLMVWQKSQHHGILSNWFCLLPWPLEYPIQFSAIFTLRVFFFKV